MNLDPSRASLLPIHDKREAGSGEALGTAVADKLSVLDEPFESLLTDTFTVGKIPLGPGRIPVLCISVLQTNQL